jgi:hypothetical protein
MEKDEREQKSPKVRRNVILQKLRFGLSTPVLIVIGAVVTIGLIGGASFTYIDTLQKNAQGKVLLDALKNTLAQEQLKIDVALNTKTAQGANSVDQKLTMTGEYKRDTGLSATADSSITNFAGINLKVQSKWVVDAADKNSTYVNLSSYSTGTTPGGSFQYTPAMEKMVKQIVDTNNKSFNNIWSKYSDDLLRGTISNTGVQGCSPKVFYATMSSPQDFQTFMTQLADVLKIQKTDSSSKTNTYTITLIADKYSKAGKTYMNSKLYKELTTCDPAAYVTTEESAKNALKNMTMTVQIDNAKKIITSIDIKNKDVMDIKFTLSPASGVSISVPKASPDILSSDAVKKYPYFSYDFDHLTNAGDMVKYGACYNYEKYKDLMPPEAIKTCETLQKR